MPELSLEFDGVQITVDLALDGTITKSPNINGLSISWQPVSGSNGRVVIEFDDTSNTLKFDSPQESLGFKIANLQTKIAGDGIQVNSTSGSYVGVEADASSIATQKIKILGLPPEDLIVLVTGSGARAVGGAYDQPVPQMSQESLVLQMTSQNSQTVEILDLVSGHSIGTRQLDVNGSTSFAGYEFELRGSAVNGDRFTIQPNTNPSGDNRNLNKMLTFQVSDTNGTGSGGFQKVFNNIVASVGAAVNSNKISYEAAEANRDAALESKSEFSGVNLDTEAAALLQYQQAYQASARVLSTARELFQTLIDVV
jgi:flagellar hook-associated protein 1 FlgK